MRQVSAFARALLAVACLCLGACASRPGHFYQDDGPPEHPPAGLAQIPDAVPRIEALNPHANRPYTALGRSYTPDTGDAPFQQRGIASWYGRQYHGNSTASGEPYDMYAMSAAHPTLPIPSYARVTRVSDGRSVIVRINDRGPFLQDRVIDLSYAAAARLGIVGPGSAEVTVQKITARDIAAGTFGERAARIGEPVAAPIAPPGTTTPGTAPIASTGAARGAQDAVADAAPIATPIPTPNAADPGGAPSAANAKGVVTVTDPPAASLPTEMAISTRVVAAAPGPQEVPLPAPATAAAPDGDAGNPPAKSDTPAPGVSAPAAPAMPSAPAAAVPAGPAGPTVAAVPGPVVPAPRAAVPAPVIPPAVVPGGGVPPAATVPATGAVGTAPAAPPGPPAATGKWAVQLGAFTVPANAQALAEQLRSLLAGPGSEALPADSRQVRVEFDGRLHRVLVGAYAQRGAAQGSARQLKQFLDRETTIYRH